MIAEEQLKKCEEKIQAFGNELVEKGLAKNIIVIAENDEGHGSLLIKATEDRTQIMLARAVEFVMKEIEEDLG